MGNLEIRDLNQSFPRDDGSQLVVLDHLSFDVKDKEFVCILGSSGCGKTTLLRLIAGLDVARAGSIILDGEEIKVRTQKLVLSSRNIPSSRGETSLIISRSGLK